MKKLVLLLTASLCMVCAIPFTGCNSGDNGGSSTTERLNTQIVTLDESGEKPAEDCPDCKPDDCKDGNCGKKKMPRARRNSHKRPAKLNDADNDCKDNDCKDGETRKFDENKPHRRRKRGHGRKIPTPTEPNNDIQPKNAN